MTPLAQKHGGLILVPKESFGRIIGSLAALLTDYELLRSELWGESLKFSYGDRCWTDQLVVNLDQRPAVVLFDAPDQLKFSHVALFDCSDTHPPPKARFIDSIEVRQFVLIAGAPIAIFQITENSDDILLLQYYC